MYVQVEKENKSRAITNSVAQKKGEVRQDAGFVDNRPESRNPLIVKKVPNPTLQKKEEEPTNHRISCGMDNVFQRKVITMSKGTIIDSELINADGSAAKDGKTRKGAISGGVQHDGGTPGTPYAGQVKKWSKIDAPWVGGHIYKHQWGGGKTVGNVVVWPNTAENIWANTFENRVQTYIDSGQSTSIGVSWSRDDELIPSNTVAANTKSKLGTPITDQKKYDYVIRKAEIDRRIANSALSYIPTVIAGSCQGETVALGRTDTRVDDALVGTINQIKSKVDVFTKTYDNVKGKPHEDKTLTSAETEYNKSQSDQDKEKFDSIKEGYQDALTERGRFGNVTNTIDGQKLY